MMSMTTTPVAPENVAKLDITLYLALKNFARLKSSLSPDVEAVFAMTAVSQ
jgi:hypothetical protein